MKKEKLRFKISNIITVLIILAIFAFVINYTSSITKNNIEITQFGPTTSGQMMGYGIKTANGKIVIVDGGRPEDTGQLLNYIKENGSKVDYWMITHPHIDHAGAFETIIQNKEEIKIDKIYMSIEDLEWYNTNEPSRIEEIMKFFDTISSENIKNKIIEPQVNDIIQMDNVKCTILGIKNPEIVEEKAINNSSMVFKIQVNNKSILFLGDTGTLSSEKLIKAQGNNLKANIVQMSHHGQAGATEELYKIVNPQICMWPTTTWLWENNSTGQEDSGPWKTKQTRSWMEEIGVKTNYIAKDGTQTFKVF